jgi:hypothetical protein
VSGQVAPKSAWKLRVDWNSAPVPQLVRYALVSIGLTPHGPAEKVAWWVNFTYQGQACTLAHEKFGLRLYLHTESEESIATQTLKEIDKKLRSSVRAVDKEVLADAPALLANGDATVVNQHYGLLQAYEYFRERATSPSVVQDVHEQFVSKDGSISGSTFTHGESVMRQHAFHDLIAAMTAYLSLLEHDLVLALPFQGFDSKVDSLIGIIGSRWKEKFARVLPSDAAAGRYRQRLTDVVERWRNPYSHGGFEKGQAATVFIQAPGVGTVPVGLTSIRDSPRFSLFPVDEAEMTSVFQLFDELDGWLRSTLPDAFAWIEAGLDVRFDHGFRVAAKAARDAGEFTDFLKHAEHRQAIVDNMDF